MAKKAKHKQQLTAPPASPKLGWVLGPGLTLAALVLRFALIPSSYTVYTPDHDDFVRWGIQATDRGVLTLYDEGGPPRHPMRVWNPQQRDWQTIERGLDRVCNYPPGSAYLLFGSGILFDGFSRDRLINTYTSRATFALWAIIGDILLAAGAAAIVGLYCPRMAKWAAYALLLLLPPFWWDSVVWGQMESVVLAPLVWMVYFMLREQWLVAGALWGLALSLKTQGILVIPLWGAAIVLALLSRRATWQPIAGAILGGVVLMLIALPHTLHSGFAWFDEAFYKNLFEAYSERTTYSAFNIWYLLALISDTMDANATWLGVTKGTWGKIFLVAGLIVGFALTVTRWRRDWRGLLIWAATSLLIFVMLPTAVHERYLVLVLPFLAAAAFVWPRFWGPLILLTVVAMGQLTHPLWLKVRPGALTSLEQRIRVAYDKQLERVPPAARDRVPSLDTVLQQQLAQPRRQRADIVGFEWILTLMALVGFGWTAFAFATLHPLPPPRRAANKPKS